VSQLEIAKNPGRGRGVGGFATKGDWQDVGGSAADDWPDLAALELDALSRRHTVCFTAVSAYPATWQQFVTADKRPSTKRADERPSI